VYDANSELQAQVTKTATFNGSAFDLKTQTPRRGLFARLIVTNHQSVGTAGNVFTPTIQHSDDGTAWTTLTTGDALTGATAAGTNEQDIPFTTRKRYVRLTITQTVTSGTPTIAYNAYIGIARGATQ